MGSRSFYGAGMLSVDEVFSPEMLVIDREIADYAERFCRGVSLDEDDFSLAAVAHGAEAGVFMGLDDTLAHFRELYWLPRLSERRMLNGWLAGGEEDMRERARVEMNRLLGTYDFELAPEQARELRRLYARAAQEIVGGTGLPEGRGEP